MDKEEAVKKMMQSIRIRNEFPVGLLGPFEEELKRYWDALMFELEEDFAQMYQVGKEAKVWGGRNDVPITCHTKEGKILKVFRSRADAHRSTKIALSTLFDLVQTKRRDKQGHYWRYATKEEINQYLKK